MTRSTSAVAVCCSSDCRNSLKSRVFSMAMTACAAKFEAAKLFVSEVAPLPDVNVIAPTNVLSLSIGTTSIDRAPDHHQRDIYGGFRSIALVPVRSPSATCFVAVTRPNGRIRAGVNSVHVVSETPQAPGARRLCIPTNSVLFVIETERVCRIWPRKVAWTFSSMAWNTGLQFRRRTELITLNTSAVAVCCSRDLLNSAVRFCSASKSRTFSMAITAWSAKVSAS